MQMKVTQRLNGLGFLGAALFVLAPTTSWYLWSSSTKAYLEAVRMFGEGSVFAAGKTYPPGVYVVLSVLSLLGLVMVVIGRDYFADQAGRE